MQQQPKLKIAQVGVGNFGAHRRATLRKAGVFDLLAVYDHNEQTLAKAAEEENAIAATSYEELLSTPGIEGVVISTGANFHAEQALAAMQRGLHVFVEKPLCSSAAEVQTLVATQKETGVTVGVGHTDHSNEKFSRRIKAIIDEGELGTVVAIEATTCHSGGMTIKPGDWRGDAEKNPGGMLFQCGVHKLHEMMYYCGPISRVSAMMRYDANRNTQTADAAVCNLQFGGGVVGSLNAYHITPYRHYLHIYGTRKNLYLETRAGEGTTLGEQEVAAGYSGAVEPIVPVAAFGTDDTCGNVRSWFHAVREGSTAYPSLQDGVRAVAVVLAAEQSARDGCTLDVLSFD